MRLMHLPAHQTTPVIPGNVFPAAARWVSSPLACGWRFFAGDPADAASWDCADDRWTAVTVPHNWNGADAAAGCGAREDPRSGYHRGAGWYRRRFDWTEPAASDRRVFVRFEAASQFAAVFLNSHPVGTHAGAFTAFCFEITTLLRDGENLLAVRVDNGWSADLAPLDGDFAIFGGLYRPVRFLVTAGSCCIDPTYYGGPRVEVVPGRIEERQATFDVRVRLAGRPAAMTELRFRVRDGAARTVVTATAAVPAGATDVLQTMALANPRLWDGRRDPHLYSVRAEFWCDGHCLDEVVQDFGLRNFCFEAERGFLLNGRRLRLHGVSRHQDRLGQGRALAEADHAEDVALMVEMGANAVRLAHYPHAETVHELCDRAGLLVWSEIPLVNGISGSSEFAASTRCQLLEMIHQQFNRAGVFAWGLTNELGMTDGPAPMTLMRDLQTLAHATDPTRQTLAANFDSTLTRYPELIPLTDQIGRNQYHGWYQGNLVDLVAAVDRLRTVVPDRGLAVSEYGAGANPAHHAQRMQHGPDPAGDWHPEEWQATVHEGNWAVIAARPWIWGSFVWNMFDFASAWRAEGGYRGLNDKGLVSGDRRLRKDAFFFYRAQWSDAPTLYLTSRRHLRRDEPDTPVKVYTNLTEIKLRLNGHVVAGGIRDGVICRWPSVVLQPGDNQLEVFARIGTGDVIRDTCQWQVLVPQPVDSFSETTYMPPLRHSRFLRRLLFVAVGLWAVLARAADYHIDDQTGDDARDGLTPATAWRSLAPANAATFLPGDRLMLRAGGAWHGGALAPGGSGSPGRPIVITAYGDGPRPALHGDGAVPAVLTLHNQSHWEIIGLELTNFSAAAEPPPARGIEVTARDAGVLSHFVLRDLQIHAINGPPANFDDGRVALKSMGAIGFLIDGNRVPTAWDDILVEDCQIHDVSYVGFANTSTWVKGHRDYDPATWFPSRSIVIRGNRIERTARDGVIVRAALAPLIEHNRFLYCAFEGNGVGCFVFDCDDAVIQYNEAAYTRYNPGDHDAQGFDSDWNCRRTLIQYNLSHHNDLGFLLLCNNGRGGFNEDTLVRYNLSYADGGDVVRFSGPVTGAQLLHNTFVLAPGMTHPMAGLRPTVIRHKSWDGWSRDTFWAANLFVFAEPAVGCNFGESTDNRFTGNAYAGTPPAVLPPDRQSLLADPLLPATAPTSLDRAAFIVAFTPSAGSPLRHASPARAGQAALDFAGRPARQADGTTDIGALAVPDPSPAP